MKPLFRLLGLSLILLCFLTANCAAKIPTKTPATATPNANPAVAQKESAAVVYVEAESFSNKGGWFLDQQSMNLTGSPVLLAHGMGRPVPDATTQVIFPKPGTYRVFVRTRNWVAPWTPQYAPGVFHLIVNGQALNKTFGNEGETWHWQDGGSVQITETKVSLALHDLTGFEGRCDAIMFTADPNFFPPSGAALETFRRQYLGLASTPAQAPKASEKPYDLVVVGGGLSGICAAVSAARLGLQVALIQDRPVLGGNNSSEARVHLRGRLNYPPYENIGNLVAQIDPIQTGIAKPASEYGDDKKLAVVKAEKNISLFLSTEMTAVVMDHHAPQGYRRPAILAVIGKHLETGKELRFEGRLFADCTGDGTLGYLAGAACRMGRESRALTGESLAPAKEDKMTMGSTMPWNTVEKLDAAGKPVQTFWPDLPWALQFTPESGFPEIKGDWNWESGIGKNQIEQVEEIRDNLFRAVYGHWSWMKNHTPKGWEDKVFNRELTWVACLLGKRESRRIMGDVILNQQHIFSGKTFDDGCVIATWDIDLHYPTDQHKKYFPGWEFKTVSDRHSIQPYLIPYRCLYSKDVPNLFMAGRDISVTHVALGSVRVMRTCGMMGEVVGMAAAVCRKHDASPRQIYQKHLSELKSVWKQGVAPKPTEYQKTARPQPIPQIAAPRWFATAGFNIATNARILVSSRQTAEQHPPRRINDGGFDYFDNEIRYLTDPSDQPHWISFVYPDPVIINALRVVSGDAPGINPLTDFVLQYRSSSESKWIDIPATRTLNNTRIDFDARFPEVKATEFRLFITRTPGGIARIWDIQFYRLQK